jgi:hypothetical protein
MAALAQSYLCSANFAALAPATQRAKRQLIEQFVGKFGKLPVAALERRHVKQIMDTHAGKPGTARNVLSVLSMLMALAVEEGIRPDNPAIGVKRPKLSRDGWHTWSEAEIANTRRIIPSALWPVWASPSRSTPARGRAT